MGLYVAVSMFLRLYVSCPYLLFVCLLVPFPFSTTLKTIRVHLFIYILR